MEKLAAFRRELYENPQLKFLFFELTDCCNLSCRHCGSSCSPKNATYLDKNLIYKVLGEVKAAYGTDSAMVCLTGGEPLLHPDFFEIIQRVFDLGFKWGMTTNATLIDGAAAEKIVKARMTSLSYSIDGTREEHDFLRNSKTAYDRCIAGITALKRYENSFVSMVTTVVHSRNIGSLDEIYAVVCSLGVDFWRLTNIDPIGNAKNSGLLLDGGGYKRLFDYIKGKRADKSSPVRVTYGCSHYLGEEYEDELRNGYFFCGSGVYTGSVCCNGDIYGCLDVERLPSLVQGNVKEDNFVDIWERRFEVFRRNRAELCADCAECDEREFCAGDSAHTWNFKENRPEFCIKKGGIL